jgi:hypothetical protein
MVRLPDELLTTIAFLGWEDAVGCFHAGGTGFLFNRSIDLPGLGLNYLVTVRHIVELAAKKSPTDVITIRLNRRDGTSEIVRTVLADWTFDPEDPFLDAAVIPIAPSDQLVDYKTIPEHMAIDSTFIEAHDIGIGDELFLLGLFSYHPGIQRNIPIVRQGILSAMPTENVTANFTYGEMRIRAYLAEVRSIGGFSGSPVFIRLDGIRGTSVQLTDVRFALLGILRGHWNTALPENQQVGINNEILDALNTGISLVIPSDSLLLLTNLPEHLAHREREKTRILNGRTSHGGDVEVPTAET